MNDKLAYIGAIIDGEGCLLIGRKRHRMTGKIKYQPSISIVSKDKNLIDMLNIKFYGITNISGHNPKTNEKYYRWLLTGFNKIESFLKEIMPFILIKRKQAEFLLNFIKSRKTSVNGKKYLPYNDVDIYLFEEIKKLKKIYPMSLPSYNFTGDERLDYLAGLIDGEGTVTIAKSKHINSFNNKKIIFTPQIIITNTDKRLMEFLKKEFGGFIIEKKREGKWRTIYQWHMQGLKEDFFKKLNGRLIIKQPQLSLILEYIESRKINYTRENEIEIFLKMQKLNKKGKMNYSYENLKKYTSLIRNPRKFFITKDELNSLYWDRGLSMRQIAKMYDVRHNTIYERMAKYSIPKRASAIAVSMGKDNS